jgi:hypothetical protein
MKTAHAWRNLDAWLAVYRRSSYSMSVGHGVQFFKNSLEKAIAVRCSVPCCRMGYRTRSPEVLSRHVLTISATDAVVTVGIFSAPHSRSAACRGNIDAMLPHPPDDLS